MTNSLESYILPDYSEYDNEIFKRGLRERVLFDDSIKILEDSYKPTHI
jgi:hypothetical protein